MRCRLAALAAATVALLFTGGTAAWGDHADGNPGLTHVCEDEPGRAAENNPHCEGASAGARYGDNDGDKNKGGDTEVHQPNEGEFQDQARSCVGSIRDCDLKDRDKDRRPAHFDVCDYGTEDSDGDGIPNECDATDDDADNDGVSDAKDNCPSHPNSNQANLDRDERGDACDAEMPLDDRDSNYLPDEVDRAVAGITQDLPS